MAKGKKGSKDAGGMPTFAELSRQLMSGDLNDPAFVATLPPELKTAVREMGKKFGIGLPAEAPARDPKERANQLADEAAASPPREALRLVEQALKLDVDCVDAWLVRGELAPVPAVAVAAFRQAVAAGERNLGPQAFTEDAGHFWGLAHTRPYMRARHELAFCLWHTGAREEAVGHALEMLRLNPEDNQGMREALIHWLLALGRDAELDELLNRYQEATALWTFARALLSFRQGRMKEAEKELKKAFRGNKHMAAYILGDERLPEQEPASYMLGSAEEAALSARMLRPAWHATPGAATWLRERQPVRRKKAPKAGGPNAAALAELLTLPQESFAWQIDFRAAADWVQADGKPTRMHTCFILDTDRQFLLGVDTFSGEPTREQLWDLLAKTMRDPAMREPHRPAEIEVLPKEVWSLLRAPLEQLGVPVRTSDTLVPLTEIMDTAEAEIMGPPRPGLLDVEGMTPELVGAFYAAAARFHRAAPWQLLSQEAAFRIDIPALGKPWYGVVMGQGGQEFGLAFYAKLAAVESLWADEGPEGGMAKSDVMSLLFGGPEFVAAQEADAAAEHGWPLAEANLFPNVMRLKPKLKRTEPTKKELRFVAAALEAVPGFLRARPSSDRRPFTATVPELEGEAEATLTWAAAR